MRKTVKTFDLVEDIVIPAIKGLGSAIIVFAFLVLVFSM